MIPKGNKKITPFGRAATHVAIAYFIYVSKNKNFNFSECDPTYPARMLRERKTVKKKTILKTKDSISK